MPARNAHVSGGSKGAILLALSVAAVLTSAAAAVDSAHLHASSEQTPAMVIGIVGGYVRHDNRAHGVVQFAERLKKDFPAGVHVAVFENHRWQQAKEEIERRLDADRDGKLSAEEKQNARIVLYGHSWGGTEAVHLASELGNEGIPVMLTIEVDSVTKPGEDGSVIPANVREAINFYQSDGWLHGRAEIRAADPSKTKILGNIRLEYKTGSCPGYPWYNRWFTVPHCAIEIDPQVWAQAESLIRATLEQPAAAGERQEREANSGRLRMAVDAMKPPQ